jgi:hypothetical protein
MQYFGSTEPKFDITYSQMQAEEVGEHGNDSHSSATLLCIRETVCCNVIRMASEVGGTLVGTGPAVLLPLHEGTDRLICPQRQADHEGRSCPMFKAFVSYFIMKERTDMIMSCACICLPQ